MLGSKQLQWINKITHLDMPVNLIILEQGEGPGNSTKAIRLTEAKTQAGMVPERISTLKQIFPFLFVIYCRFSFCLWSYCDVYVLGPKTVTLHRHETCTVSNIIPCQIFSSSGFLGRLHYTTRHFSVFLAETQNIISRENKTLQRLLLEKKQKKTFLPRAALIRLNLMWWR